MMWRAVASRSAAQKCSSNWRTATSCTRPTRCPSHTLCECCHATPYASAVTPPPGLSGCNPQAIDLPSKFRFFAVSLPPPQVNASGRASPPPPVNLVGMYPLTPLLLPWKLIAGRTTVDVSAALFGTLSWEVAASFPVVKELAIKTPNDPLSAWNLQPTIDWFPSCPYFNIYAQAFIDEWNVGTVDKAVWIGTSGSDGQRNGFNVLPENLPFPVNPATKVRFHIQGVKDCGGVLKWEKCAYVDVSSR